MVDDLRCLGFRNVGDTPTRRLVRTRRRIFSCAPINSDWGWTAASCSRAAAPRSSTATTRNSSGCRWKQILADFPRIDFLLRSHSSAGPIPYCVENYERLPPEDAGAKRFRRPVCPVCAPRRGTLCDSVREQSLLSAPGDHRIQRHRHDTRRSRQALSAGRRQRRQSDGVRRDAAGQHLERPGGLSIQSFDFATRAEYIDSMLSRHGGKLTSYYAQGGSRQRRFRLLPRLLREDDGGHPAPDPAPLHGACGIRGAARFRTRFWRVDPAVPTVAELAAPLAGDVVFEVHAAVLRDCTRNRMFSVWSASKRLKIKLPAPRAVAIASRWLTVLHLYGRHFPSARNFSARALAIRLRRWREPAELAALLLRRMLSRRPTTIASLYPLKAT